MVWRQRSQMVWRRMDRGLTWFGVESLSQSFGGFSYRTLLHMTYILVAANLSE